MDGRGATRSVGARVILVDGLAAGYLRRGERELLLSSPRPSRSGRRSSARSRARLLELAVGTRTGTSAAC